MVYSPALSGTKKTISVMNTQICVCLIKVFPDGVTFSFHAVRNRTKVVSLLDKFEGILGLKTKFMKLVTSGSSTTPISHEDFLCGNTDNHVEFTLTMIVTFDNNTEPSNYDDMSYNDLRNKMGRGTSKVGTVVICEKGIYGGEDMKESNEGQMRKYIRVGVEGKEAPACWGAVGGCRKGKTEFTGGLRVETW